MSLTTLFTNIGIVAILLTLLIGFVLKKKKSWPMSFLQNFCGVLFLFSGWVKAVDPWGTAYKMEQYFGEFESVFQETWFSFLAPLFPILSSYAIAFSIFMLVFEIALGMMLIIGYKPKWTAWAFLILVAFFTFLTGFTYLTGYVPQDANFFQFGSWGPYVASNMKVTDCGCFGDFIKLEPKTSFFKDVFLMIPALYFLFRSKDMHQLFTSKIRGILSWATTIITLFYCYMNSFMGLPQVDFRPFYKSADVKNKRIAEMDAMAAVDILAYRLKNKTSNEVVELKYDQYLKNYKNYPKEEWDVLEQVKEEPTVAPTKISDFEFSDLEGNDITEEFLDNPNPVLLVVSHKMKGKANKVKEMVKDSIFNVDTMAMDGTEELMIIRKFDRVEEKEVTRYDYIWDTTFKSAYANKIAPILKKAKADGIQVYVVTGGADPDMLKDFESELNLGAEYLTADDILLKTLLRSNPGLMLWKGGKILDKWHYKELDSYDAIKAKF